MVSNSGVGDTAVATVVAEEVPAEEVPAAEGHCNLGFRLPFCLAESSSDVSAVSAEALYIVHGHKIVYYSLSFRFLDRVAYSWTTGDSESSESTVGIMVSKHAFGQM